ncbi:PH domain-containing protein [Luteipulveratus flavus]|uniref:PH domain-containing protein n=1 Tax=Luteipulveratus flavus TaxID=3031728 RepID=A0ABT6C454_9MICO|nr:PH domain-containing protein [Luteipulveratus sp. YIM 133296]MDF8263052.1 PH domain-containing protein [Luteipulveratus sp. YIM 133296]
MSSSSDPAQRPQRHVFRQRAALGAGGFLLLVMVVVVVTSLFDLSRGSVDVILWCTAIALVVWVVLLRPSVQLTQGGLVLHNLVRDVRMPWPQVDIVESRWNLKIFTPQDQGYSAWAISSQRPKPNVGGSGGMLGGLGALGQLRGSTGRVATEAPIGPSERAGSAGAVAVQVQLAREDYDRAVGAGAVEKQSGPVVVRPALVPILALALAIALALSALLT